MRQAFQSQQAVISLGNRRENKQKEYEYEVKFRDGSEQFISLKTHSKRIWEKDQ